MYDVVRGRKTTPNSTKLGRIAQRCRAESFRMKDSAEVWRNQTLAHL